MLSNGKEVSYRPREVDAESSPRGAIPHEGSGFAVR
jgi:hypothetical protein